MLVFSPGVWNFASCWPKLFSYFRVSLAILQFAIVFSGVFCCPASAQRVQAGRQDSNSHTPLKMPLLQMQFHCFTVVFALKSEPEFNGDFVSKYLRTPGIVWHPHPQFTLRISFNSGAASFCSLYTASLRFFLLNFFAQKEWRCPGFFHTYIWTLYTYSRRLFIFIRTVLYFFPAH